MPEYAWFVIFFVAYFAVMKWVLPRFGVAT
jgi:hypothetical protein